MGEAIKRNGDGENQSVLIKMHHGLGDAVQFTSVLRHLEKYKPNWRVHVVADIGKSSALEGLCDRVMNRSSDSFGFHYNRVFGLSWDENYCRYIDKPNTKITKCLEEVFRINYDWSLGGYKILRNAQNQERAIEYFNRIGLRASCEKFPVVLVHYQGNTSPWKKNLTDQQARVICEFLKTRGLVPVILDWDNRSPLIDQVHVFSPSVHDRLWGGIGTGCASTIAELIRLSVAYIGIDSGPGKVASATDTPTWICWTGHHPFQFHDPSYNTRHILSDQPIPPSENAEIRKLFEREYQHTYYKSSSSMVDTLIRSFIERFEPAIRVNSDSEFFEIQPGFFVRKKFYDEDACIWRDVAVDNCYKIPSLPAGGEGTLVVDVGACFGAFAFAWHKRNPHSKIVCVEPSPSNWDVLKKNVSEFAEIIYGAVWYGGPVYLADSLSGSVVRSTGGSWLAESESQVKAMANADEYKFIPDLVKTCTLEEILAASGMERIDAMKLDCEGSEYNILRETPSLHKIDYIFGEYHDCDRWLGFHPHVFSAACWNYHGADASTVNGLFHAKSKVRVKMGESFSIAMQALLGGHQDPHLRAAFLENANMFQSAFDLTDSGAIGSLVEVCDNEFTGLSVASVNQSKFKPRSRCVSLADEDLFFKRFRAEKWDVMSLAAGDIHHFPRADLCVVFCKNSRLLEKTLFVVRKSGPKFCLIAGLGEMDEPCEVRLAISKSGLLADYDCEEACSGVVGKHFAKLTRKGTVVPLSGNAAFIATSGKVLGISDLEKIKGYLVENNLEVAHVPRSSSSFFGALNCLGWVKLRDDLNESAISIDPKTPTSSIGRRDFLFSDSAKKDLAKLLTGSKNCLYHVSVCRIEAAPGEVSLIRKKGYRVALMSVTEEEGVILKENLHRFDDAIFPGSAWDAERKILYLASCELVITSSEELDRLARIFDVPVVCKIFDPT